MQSTLRIHLKKMNFITNKFVTQDRFLLEELRTKYETQTGNMQYVLTCGLHLEPNVIPTIGVRFVSNNNTAIPLSGDEALAKQQFAQAKGLVRGTSVYYSLTECQVVAKLVINHSKLTGLRCHVNIFSIPNRDTPSSEIMCNSVTLDPSALSQITAKMVDSIAKRHIISWQ